MIEDDFLAIENLCQDGENVAARMRKEYDDIRGENTRLRAALASSEKACVYCQLPAADMAKCQFGFPGCGRADDYAGCPEFGATIDMHLMAKEVCETLNPILDRCIDMSPEEVKKVDDLFTRLAQW